MWFVDWCEDDSSASLVLVLNEFFSMITFLMRVLLEALGKAMESHVISIKIGGLQ